MAFLSLMGINANTAWGQEKKDPMRFNLYNWDVRITKLTVNGVTDYYCGYWNGSDWTNYTGSATGNSYRYKCSDYSYLWIFHVNSQGANDPGASPPAVATNHVVIIESRNPNYSNGACPTPTTLATVDYTFEITLENVNIDATTRESDEYAPFNAGDDCISVNLTLKGTNYLKAKATALATINYNR